jgi:hypothetical protein
MVGLRHAKERGTAIFVVVLVVTLLTSVGLFAARITGSVDAATGYARQSAQAKGLAIYSSQMATAVLGSDSTSISGEMSRVVGAGVATFCATNRYAVNTECALRRHEDLVRVSLNGSGSPLLALQGEADHGSLGPLTGLSTVAGLEGNLQLEYFERMPATLPGYESGSNLKVQGPPRFEYGVTASAQIRPILGTVSAQWCSPDNQTSTANVQSIRMYVNAP